MKLLTATNFRHTLFPTLEAAAKGEEVIITHKGRRFKLRRETEKTWLENIAGKARIPGVQIRGPVVSPWDQSAWVKKWKKRGS